MYGFAAGHLCGLLFRKLVVACGVAGIVGGVGGGAVGAVASGRRRQALAALAAPRRAARDRLLPLAGVGLGARLDAPAITVLASGAFATILIMAAGIGYRVLEVPLRAGSEDDIAFVASLPNIEKNHGGREFKASSERFSRLAMTINPDRPNPADARGTGRWC